MVQDMVRRSDDIECSEPMQTDFVEFVQQLLRTMREWKRLRQMFPPKMFTLSLDENDEEGGFAYGRGNLFVVPMEF